MAKRNEKNTIDNTREAIALVTPGMLPFLQYCIDPFIGSHPYWGLALYTVIGLYGVYLTLSQNRLNEIISFINDHPKEFKKEIVESEEFRLGFIRIFDNYIKERLENKRHILRYILLGFAINTEKQKFELERLQDTLISISPNSLEQLVFVKKEILPILVTKIEKTMSKLDVQPEDYDKVVNFYWKLLPISQEISNWVYRKYPKSELDIELASSSDNIQNTQSKSFITNSRNEDYNLKQESWLELDRLGIFNVLDRKDRSVTYYLTKFGRDFINYIPEKIP